MTCKPSCKLCKNLIISQSVTSTTIDGVATLLIDLPAGTYGDCCKYCIVIAQAIDPATPISAVVSFSIGGDTTTVYPFVRCDCSQVTACAIRTRTRYSTVVSTNAVGGVFKSLGGLSCSPNNNLASLPVATTTTPAVAEASVMSLRAVNTVEPVAKATKTTTKKEGVDNA